MSIVSESAQPVPPIFHAVAMEASVGPAPVSQGGEEIRLTVTLHENVRLTFALQPDLALAASGSLEAAYQKLLNPTGGRS